MKTLFTLLLAAFTMTAFAQITIDTVGDVRTELKEYRTGEKTLVFNFRTDTIDATSDPDTFLLKFTPVFASSMVGLVTVSQDTVTGESPLTADYFILQSHTGTDTYKSVGDDTIPTDPASVIETIFPVRKAFLEIMIIATAGKGLVNGWLTVKPSSISDQ